ncbi:MAG: alpha/beta hydrolase, partial [Cyanobacteria bacterium P01_A01_bin.135]
MSEPKGQYLLSIEPIPPKGVEPSQVACSEDNSPAYFVGSTAPNNVEQEVNPVTPPDQCIKTIAKQLVAGEQRELLVAIHGYNMSIGTYQQGEQPGAGVKGWYQDIWHHIAENGLDRSGLMLIGYRWPSERIRGEHTPPYGDDTLGAKIRSAQRALPKALKLVLIGAVALLVLLVAVALLTDWLRGAVLGTGGVALLIVAVMLLSIILTLFLLRIAGYFRDRYRANNFGVAELVELFRHLDRAILEATPEGRWKDAGADSVEAYWDNNRIKLSFIGHSMGSFVVTDTVRILSDVFDKHSIGNLALDGGAAKQPTREIGDVFSLERLVLVSPDIPAEAIISSRANFLRSSLRRFKEAYLFTNEGDMALKLASTAANYASFPASTRERGYRLGNVTVRIPEDSLDAQSHRYGIVNLMSLQKGDNSKASFLRYLY